MTHFDPSWCARINAPRRTAAEGASGPAAASAPATRPSPPDASPQALPGAPAAYACDLCGAGMYEHNCKIVCPNCGYKRDCTDP